MRLLRDRTPPHCLSYLATHPRTRTPQEFGWGRRQIFTWSHGDGGPSKRRAPDGGSGYYFLGKEKRLLPFDADDEGFHHCNHLLQTLGERDAATADADPRSLRQYLVDNGVVEPYLSLADSGYCEWARGAGRSGSSSSSGGGSPRASHRRSVVCSLALSSPAPCRTPAPLFLARCRQHAGRHARHGARRTRVPL